jgi:hypothetical protein
VTFTFLSLPNTRILAPFGTDNPYAVTVSLSVPNDLSPGNADVPVGKKVAQTFLSASDPYPVPLLPCLECQPGPESAIEKKKTALEGRSQRGQGLFYILASYIMGTGRRASEIWTVHVSF